MNIEIRCNNCDKRLTILNTEIVPGMNTIRLEVPPCRGKDCQDCENCEDMEQLKKVNEEIVELKAKLAAHEAIP